MDAALARRSEYRGRITDLQVRDSGSADYAYTVRGHFAVYDSLSLDLGGFREKIDPGAFDNVLARGPAVLAVWDHDTRWILGNTDNGTLELSSDSAGLVGFARVPKTTYADELRTLLEGGYISQASFMFTIERESYDIVGDGDREMVVFTIEEVGELYDVTVTGRGAYPQTDVSLAMARSARREQVRELLGDEATPAPAVSQPEVEAGDGTEEPEAEPVEPVAEDGSAQAEIDPAVAEAQRVKTLALARVHVDRARKP